MLDNILEILKAIEHLKPVQDFVANIPWLVTVCTAITAVTKTSWPENPLMNTIFKVLNVLAGNILLNKNADEVNKK